MQQAEIIEINILEIFGLMLLLLAAIAIQFIFHDLPCPLCLLQRFGIVAISFGFLLNLRFGIRPSHYALSILSTLYTAAVAMRQILLHIVPGSATFGPAVFGLHLYTWVFIICVCLLLFITFMLLFDKQFKTLRTKKNKALAHIISAVFFITIAVTLINSVTTFLECGFRQCPDNPMLYQF